MGPVVSIFCGLRSPTGPAGEPSGSWEVEDAGGPHADWKVSGTCGAGGRNGEASRKIRAPAAGPALLDAPKSERRGIKPGLAPLRPQFTHELDVGRVLGDGEFKGLRTPIQITVQLAAELLMRFAQAGA